MVEVLRAGLEDLDALYHIYENDGREHRRSLRTYPIMNMFMDENNVFLIARDPQPLGFLHLRLKGGEAKIDLFSIIVSAPAGVGKRLLDEAEKYASSLLVYVPKTDTALLAVFQKNGFENYNEVANLFGEGVPGLLLTKTRTSAVARPAAARRKRKRQARPKRLTVSPVLIENLKKLGTLS